MSSADRAAAAAAGPSGAQSRRAAGASVSPAGRRRHSGAQCSPLPIVPRAPTAFPSVAGRGRSESPARPFPPPAAPAAGEAGVACQRSKVGRSGGQARAVELRPVGTITPAGSPGAGAGSCCGAGDHPPYPFAPAPCPWRIPESPPPRRTTAQARGKLRLYCSLPGAAIQTDPVLWRGRPRRGNSGLLLV